MGHLLWMYAIHWWFSIYIFICCVIYTRRDWAKWMWIRPNERTNEKPSEWDGWLMQIESECIWWNEKDIANSENNVRFMENVENKTDPQARIINTEHWTHTHTHTHTQKLEYIQVIRGHTHWKAYRIPKLQFSSTENSLLNSFLLFVFFFFLFLFFHLAIHVLVICTNILESQ